MTEERGAAPSGHQPGLPGDPYADALGPFFRRETPEGTVYAFTVLEKHMNMSGNAHGGMLGSFAALAHGLTAQMACAGMKAPMLSISLSYLAAARIGDRVECRPEVIRQTAGVLFIKGDFVAGGRVILTANSLWEAIRTRPEITENSKIQG